ncbi:GH92 family glycosyl hydrolase [Mucilaginibacter myungsuensis]|uniref:GH92 family glycosyl hydrolase n=1 Tax=Mucilaginibacter myungsuensis TaxID=649104 RepID=A0A929KTB6_9SPHI|nr:GH92 family glycosyl hydrolase [Mucilaginibacter myungsuensis]MBE9660792.1 GH92 family glycosyl hydrolase [Mucilaginibacter myungsuensis]MDN3600838.1 GH92 family glycosyl hydrolase [Mucilaginibacter myungsuensis]
MKTCKALFAALVLLACTADAQKRPSNLQYVDPSIGSVGLILEPTRPTIHLPNQMIRVAPNRKDALDDQISHFPLCIASHRIVSLFNLMPVSGPNMKTLWNEREVYNHEILTPYYYKSELGDAGNLLEFSPSVKSGFFKIAFKGNNNNYVRIGLSNAGGNLSIDSKRSISGTEELNGMKAYLYAETDGDIAQAAANGKTLMISTPKNIGFKYAISYISIEQAKQNLQRDILAWDFAAVKSTAYRAWDKVMSQIQVDGGTLAQKRVFYTSLYRCYERMVDINEGGKYYSNYDHQIHQSTKPFFVDNWIWDTYIALGPLHMILDPDKELDKINSYVDMYKQGGWMPSFALIFGDWPAMTGNHAATWMADAWFKGIRNFDLKTAYQGLRKNSVEATLLPWNNGAPTKLDSFYNAKGYMPGLHYGEPETEPRVEPSWEKRQSVSVTLENSYSDWNIARLANELNFSDHKDLFMKRSKFYQNVYRKDRGFMWAKDKDGKWIDNMDPKAAGREFFTENNAYTYNWVIKHDFRGLFDMMGGTKQAENKLDQLFREDLGTAKFIFWKTQPDASGLVGQFVMGNEPSFHIPYLYNYMGAPWKTQKRIRMLLDTWYTDNLFGIPGDEDGGGMTSFVVFSMMGFFPVTAGVPVYNVGSPVFTKVVIDLPNGKKFTINAPQSTGENKYIQSATLNGAPLNRPWFTHKDLIDGGTINLQMGNRPNRSWGAASNDAPPSDGDQLYNKW